MHICDTLMHAAHILTQDDARSEYENASIAIANGRIAAIGPRAYMAGRWQAGRMLDLGASILMPGLINAHTHGAMTFLRGFADDLPLMDWLTQNIFPVEARLTPHIVEYGSLLAYAEMLRTGTTATKDMYIFEDAVFKAAHTAGIRCMGGEVVFNFPSAACTGPNFADAALERTRDYVARYAEHPRIGVIMCPHSVYTTTPELLVRCKDMAETLGIPLHIHLAESSAETAQCYDVFGTRPVALCHSLGLLGPRTSLAHVVDVNDADMDTIAASGAITVHCPASNMKLASGVAPVTEMLARGITVALGTDGAASNNQINMFAEMRMAALLHKVHRKDPTAMPAQCVLDMATRNGAIALQQPDLGRLVVGGPADIIALDLHSPNMQPMYTAPSHIVYAATGCEVRLTMVAGEILYEDGVYTRFDYAALCDEIRAIRTFVCGLKK